jgi:hypothetical protein
VARNADRFTEPVRMLVLAGTTARRATSGSRPRAVAIAARTSSGQWRKWLLRVGTPSVLRRVRVHEASFAGELERPGQQGSAAIQPGPRPDCCVERFDVLLCEPTEANFTDTSSIGELGLDHHSDRRAKCRNGLRSPLERDRLGRSRQSAAAPPIVRALLPPDGSLLLVARDLQPGRRKLLLLP